MLVNSGEPEQTPRFRPTNMTLGLCELIVCIRFHTFENYRVFFSNREALSRICRFAASKLKPFQPLGEPPEMYSSQRLKNRITLNKNSYPDFQTILTAQVSYIKAFSKLNAVLCVLKCGILSYDI